MSETIKKGYALETMIVSRENIDDFEIMETRRQIGEFHIRNILAALGGGKNSIGIIIVNKKRNVMRLIDGNHRIEALRRFLNRRTQENTKVEVTLKVYKELTDEEERKVYTIEATRRNESYEDRLNMYKDTIIIWKLFSERESDFPCKVTIYSSKVSLRFRNILNAIHTAKNSTKKGYNPLYLRKDNMVEFAQDLKYDDYTLMKEFVLFFQSAFGRVESSNMYSRPNFFVPLYNIYVRNKGKNGKKMTERFRRIIGRSELINLMNTHGREDQKRIRDIMIGYMNHGVSKNLFI